MTQAARTAAARFFDLIPPAMPLEVLEEYGLTVTIPQAQTITKEIIALSAYWIRCALQAGIPEQFGKTIGQCLTEHIQLHWESKFGLESFSFEGFLGEMSTRHAAWDELTRKGGKPFTVLSQAAKDLEKQDLVSRDNQQCLAILFLDFVPIDEIGALAEAIEEGI